jgi:hypothetical protein
MLQKSCLRSAGCFNMQVTEHYKFSNMLLCPTARPRSQPTQQTPSLLSAIGALLLTAVSGLSGNAFAQSAYGALPLAAMLQRNELHQSLDRGVTGGYVAATGKLAPFAIYSNINLETKGARLDAFEITSNQLTTGVAQSAQWGGWKGSFGAAITGGVLSTDSPVFDLQGRPSRTPRSYAVTGFASARLGQTYATTKVSYGSDQGRGVGPDARTFGLELAGGYDFAVPLNQGKQSSHIVFGPTGAMTLQRQSFEQAFLPKLSQTVSTASVGVRAVGDFLYWKPYGKLSVVRGSSRLSVDRSWAQTELGVQGRPTERWLVSAGVSRNSGQRELQSTRFSLSVNAVF